MTLHFPTIDPVAVHIGPLAVHWYGLMYLVGFSIAYLLARTRAKRSTGWTHTQVSDLIFYAAIGVVLGGRLGYMLFYDAHVIISDPWQILRVWQGGMSFHGGLLGVMVAVWIFARRYHKTWGEVADFIAPLVPLGLGTGRLGNFINGELWGRVTDVPWAMVFPTGGPLPRHPSQLYEFFLEGIVLFTVVWWFSSRKRPRYAVASVFLLGYGICRVIAECFREPDAPIGFLWHNWLTMGQLLSFPMILVGAIGLWWAYRGQKKCKSI